MFSPAISLFVRRPPSNRHVVFYAYGANVRFDGFFVVLTKMECNRKASPYLVAPSQAAKEDAVQIVVFVGGPLLDAIALYAMSSL